MRINKEQNDADIQTVDLGGILPKSTRDFALLPESYAQFSHLPQRFRSVSYCRNLAARLFAAELAYGAGFLYQAIGFSLGAAMWLSLPKAPPNAALIISLIFLLFISIASNLLRRPSPLWLKILLAILLGMGAAEGEIIRRSTVLLDGSLTTTISGTVERRAVDHRGIWRYELRLTQTSDPEIRRAPEYVSVVARQAHEAFDVGSLITGRARISPPSGPAYYGAHDFSYDAYFSGIGASGFFYAKPQYAPEQPAMDCFREISTCADRALYRLRAYVAERIRSTIGGDEGAFAASIITDERRAISPETMDALRQSGLAHIVAISGLNMALAAGIFFIGLRSLLALSQVIAERYPVKKISAFCALIMTLLYYLISGFAVSAERAFIMTSVMLIAVLMDRQAISLRNVAISAIIILLFSPSQVLRVSFQMSFAATIALVAIYGFWTRSQTVRGGVSAAERRGYAKALRFIALVILTTISTSLIGGFATAPFSISYFNQFSSFGLIANLLAMPVMGLIVMPSALLAMLLMPLSLDHAALILMGQGMKMVIAIAHYVADLGSEAMVGKMPPWYLPVVAIAALLMASFRTKLGFVFAPVIVGASALAFAAPLKPPQIIIHESGEAILVRANDTYAVNRPRANSFVIDQWRRAYKLEEIQVAKRLVLAIGDLATGEHDDDALASDFEKLIAAAESDTGTFYCISKIGCVLSTEGDGLIVELRDAALIGNACDVSAIVVIARPLRIDRCRSGANLFTGRTLRKSGTIEFHREEIGGSLTKYAALERQYRAWHLHRYYDWRSGSFDDEPPALILSDSGE